MKQTNPTYVPGIDQPLPEGETLLWSGKPTVRAQLRHGLFLRVAAAWLAVAAVLPFFTSSGTEGSPAAHLAWTGVVGVLVLGLTAAFAWMVRRTTVYALTDRRVIMKIGIALPSVLNIPMEELAGASCRAEADGSGDIAFPLAGRSELGWALLWPHVRPWRMARAEPAMRFLEEVEEVAGILTVAALDAGRFEAAELPSAPAPRHPAFGLEERTA